MSTRSLHLFADDQEVSKLPAWVKTAKQISDGHLVQVARAHGALLTTLDRKIPTALVIPTTPEASFSESQQTFINLVLLEMGIKRVAMKMGRQLRCASVTSSTSLTSRRANQLATCKRQTGAGCSLLPPVRLGPPCRRGHFDRNKLPLISGTRQDSQF
jgi:hypothetical protein